MSEIDTQKDHLLIEKRVIDDLKKNGQELIEIGGAFDTSSYIKGQTILDLIKHLEEINLYNQNQIH